MPRFIGWAVLLVIGVNLIAQQTTNKKDEKKPAEAQKPVAPDDFVVFLPAACQTPPGSFAVRGCERGITRRQFEELLAATQPNATPEYKQRLAEMLGEVLILSNEAKKRELPKDPAVQELLHFLELQQLGNMLVTRALKQDAAPSESEILAYYRQHFNEYETADFLRIIVPMKTAEPMEDDQQFADSIRARCAAGEDPAKLQAESDQRVSRPAAQPVELKNQRRVMFPQAQQTIFDLKNGECQIIAPNKSDVFVYKMVARSETPGPEARLNITNILQSTKIHEQVDALKKSSVVSLNSKYFPPETQTKPAPAEKHEEK